MLRSRILTALLITPLALLTLISGGIILQFFALLLVVGMNIEFALFSLSTKRQISLIFALLFSLPSISYLLFGVGGLLPAFYISLLTMSILQLVLIERPIHQSSFASDVPASLCGICYTGFLGTLFLIVVDNFNAGGVYNNPLIWFVLIVIASDTGAYFGGRYFQGEKLAPRISPGKTRSGAVVGFLTATIVAVLAANFLHLQYNIVLIFAVGMLIALTAPIGDLFESLFKRIYNVKDSSQLLPGHGGLLDRFDSYILAAPLLLLLKLL
jgi:phosphatidate cytidylyltransferase